MIQLSTGEDTREKVAIHAIQETYVNENNESTLMLISVRKKSSITSNGR